MAEWISCFKEILSNASSKGELYLIIKFSHSRIAELNSADGVFQVINLFIPQKGLFFYFLGLGKVGNFKHGIV